MGRTCGELTWGCIVRAGSQTGSNWPPLTDCVTAPLQVQQELRAGQCASHVEEPFNSTPVAVSPISSGSPHVRPMGALSTCSEPDEIKKNTHPPGIYYAPTRNMLPLCFVSRHVEEQHVWPVRHGGRARRRQREVAVRHQLALYRRPLVERLPHGQGLEVGAVAAANRAVATPFPYAPLCPPCKRRRVNTTMVHPVRSANHLCHVRKGQPSTDGMGAVVPARRPPVSLPYPSLPVSM